MEEKLVQVRGVSILEIAGVGPEGRPLVHPDGFDEPVEARTVWMRESPDWTRCAGLRALVAFPEEEGPVILGLLDPPPVSAGSADRKGERRVRIEGEEEVVIECGKAKIALRADGRIEIRGGHLISRSSGPNKIKGATVHIN